MLAFLLGLLGPLGDFIVKLLKGLPPAPVVIEAEKAGAAQQAVTDLEHANDETQKAAAAVRAVDRSISTDDGLRAYAATDPNNRDTAPARK